MQSVDIIFGMGPGTVTRHGILHGKRYICLPKAAGGLGVRNINLYNQVVVGKQVWAIAHKKDNMGQMGPFDLH